jgi:hypothetical protein
MRTLRDVAHCRTGDKGNSVNVSVIAYDVADYPLLERHVTAECVKAHFAGVVHGDVERYTLPKLGALNFVLHEALAGGVTRTLALDAHGKALSSAFLTLNLPEAAGDASAEVARDRSSSSCARRTPTTSSDDHNPCRNASSSPSPSRS